MAPPLYTPNPNRDTPSSNNNTAILTALLVPLQSDLLRFLSGPQRYEQHPSIQGTGGFRREANAQCELQLHRHHLPVALRGMARYPPRFSRSNDQRLRYD